MLNAKLEGPDFWPITTHPLPVTRHSSPVTRHSSLVTRYPSLVTRHYKPDNTC